MVLVGVSGEANRVAGVVAARPVLGAPVAGEICHFGK